MALPARPAARRPGLALASSGSPASAAGGNRQRSADSVADGRGRESVARSHFEAARGVGRPTRPSISRARLARMASPPGRVRGAGRWRAEPGNTASMSHTAICWLTPHHAHGGERTHHDDGPRGPIDPSLARSQSGLRAVGLSLAVLGLTALVQGVIYLTTGSIALLADLIHNAGDALTALPLALAFWARSQRAERHAGIAVVLTILASAVAAGAFAVERIIHPLAPEHLLALAAAGLVGVVGNALAARVRLRAGRRLGSPALMADGQHAQSDALVSVGVVASATAVALDAPIADPIIGLLITAPILHITWESWQTVRGATDSLPARPQAARSSLGAEE
jgi:Co/Zn/Cd efflux system component